MVSEQGNPGSDETRQEQQCKRAGEPGGEFRVDGHVNKGRMKKSGRSCHTLNEIAYENAEYASRIALSNASIGEGSIEASTSATTVRASTIVYSVIAWPAAGLEDGLTMPPTRS